MKLFSKIILLILAPVFANAQVSKEVHDSGESTTSVASKAHQLLPLLENSNFNEREKHLIVDLADGKIRPAQLSLEEIHLIKSVPPEIKRIILSKVNSGDPCSC